MARLFTAVELSASAREAIAAGQRVIAEALRGGGEGLRLVKPPHLHITLVFIGEVAEERVSAFVEAMSEDLAVAPFVIGLGKAGIFPPRGGPRVLWYGVDEGAAQLTSLQAAVFTRLAALGVAAEGRPFRPHLTIGRWKGEHVRRPREPLPELAAPVREQIDRVTLFRSQLRPTGPEHTPLAVSRLAGGRGRTGRDTPGLH